MVKKITVLTLGQHTKIGLHVKKTDNTLFSYRRLNLVGFFITGASLAYASTVLEQHLSAINCSLCSIVRLSLLCMSIVFLLAFVHNPWTFGQRLYGLINWLFAILGLSAAGRYVWLELQHAETICSAGFNRDFETLSSTLPFLSDLQTLLANNNECLDNTWQYLGLSLPQITMGVFILLFLITWRLLTRRPEPKLFF
ncbi:disulfide bond formation protein B [Neptunomonas japonica]|uniref:disulfide bond formation protein B n=1 Tax=Neptunomonas japonica TaxID=417574 RepID=UPI002E2FDBDB|nr:disulfide bond formation protein B [Neptunomonas japonica]